VTFHIRRKDFLSAPLVWDQGRRVWSRWPINYVAGEVVTDDSAKRSFFVIKDAKALSITSSPEDIILSEIKVHDVGFPTARQSLPENLITNRCFGENDDIWGSLVSVPQQGQIVPSAVVLEDGQTIAGQRTPQLSARSVGDFTRMIWEELGPIQIFGSDKLMSCAREMMISWRNDENIAGSKARATEIKERARADTQVNGYPPFLSNQDEKRWKTILFSLLKKARLLRDLHHGADPSAIVSRLNKDVEDDDQSLDSINLASSLEYSKAAVIGDSGLDHVVPASPLNNTMISPDSVASMIQSRFNKSAKELAEFFAEVSLLSQEPA